MQAQIQLRRDSAANWTSENPTLEAGEIGFELDTYKVKIGDGATDWNTLAYFSSGGGGSPDWGDIGGTLSDQTDLQLELDAKLNASGTDILTTLNLSGVLEIELTGDEDNYNPTGLDDVSVLRLFAYVDDYEISGIAGGVNNRVLIIQNVGGARIKLLADDTSSTNTNRLFFFGDTMTLWANSAAIFIYDSVTGDTGYARWVYAGRGISLEDINTGLSNAGHDASPDNTIDKFFYYSVTSGTMLYFTWAELRAFFIAAVTPGTAGNILTSDGTDWASEPPVSGGGNFGLTVFMS